MGNTSLSIITPTLNEEKYLPILLSSLAFQTNKNFEVIICDGESEDRTKEKAVEFRDKLNIKVYDSSKRNVCHQRNFGAKKAKGDYLIFIDADHWVNNNFIESIYKEISKTKIDVIVPEDYYAKKLFWVLYSIAQIMLVRTVYTLFKKPFVIGPTIIIKKNIFEKIGGYDESVVYLEEPYLLKLAYESGAKISYPKGVKAYCSTRRMDKTGTLKFLCMHAVASYHYIFKGAIRKKIFEFEMGGHVHEKDYHK